MLRSKTHVLCAGLLILILGFVMACGSNAPIAYGAFANAGAHPRAYSSANSRTDADADPHADTNACATGGTSGARRRSPFRRRKCSHSREPWGR